MKKLAFISLAAIMASFVASADTIVTSKTYVDNKDNLKQNAITAGTAGSLVTYVGTTTTNGGANLGEQAVFSSTTASSYDSTNDASKIPTMGAVMAQISNSASGVLPSATANQVLQYNATNSAWESTTMDSAPTSASVKPVTSGGVYTALSGKQDTLTFDSTPTASSTNPVTSGGVKTYVDGKVSSASTVSSSSTTTAPNEKAVYDLVSPIQTAVTNLQGCTHTCASSDGTAVCDLITINCVQTASQSNG